MNHAQDDILSYATTLQASTEEVYAVGEDVKNYIPSLRDDDVGRVVIFNGQLVYTGEDLSETDLETAESLGYLNMSEEDYGYMLGLHYLEVGVKNHAEDTTKIGTALGTSSNPYVTIAGINYGLGWYKIITAEELTSLGLSENQQSYLLEKDYSTNGYIVKYNSSSVQCVKGKMMYAGESNEIWEYTFNYAGEENGVVVTNMLTGVTKDSTKTASQFGELVPTKTYAASGTTSGVIENYYKDDYTYDIDGGVILTNTTNILSMPIDQTKPINNMLSVNITFKCDIDNQVGYPYDVVNSSTVGGCLFAISDVVSLFTTRISIYKGWLKVFTYTNDSNLNAAYDYSRNGLAVFDISEYNNKYVNLQVTAKCNEKTKIYINGSLVKEINSGTLNNLTYNYCTIGDVRSGRGMKFAGNVYNFALYGDILSDEEVAQNWNYVKNELGINEAGDKVN
jgi:hypothetical protein